MTCEKDRFAGTIVKPILSDYNQQDVDNHRKGKQSHYICAVFRKMREHSMSSSLRSGTPSLQRLLIIYVRPPHEGTTVA